MNRIQKEEENRRSIQVVILFCYAIYSIGLATSSIIRGWEMWVVPILFIGNIICFSVYVSQQFEFRFRIYLYSGFVSLATFYYGTHEEIIYSFSLVIVLSMMVFSLTEEKGALRILFMTYVLLIMYHFIMLILGMELIKDLHLSLILFNVIAVIVAFQVGGYICEMLSISRGVSDELENELAEMKKKSEDFMANVSHELRTPINVVIGLTSILLKDEKERRRRANLHAIQGAGHRLFARIEDILDYTEIDTGSVVISEDEYHITSIINDVAAEFRESGGKDSPELIIDMDVNIPSRMLGDANRLKRIIRHVVTNALKFTDSSGCVFLKVFARKKDYGVNLCIEVTDTGIGMAPDEIARVTSAAYQSDSGRSRRVEGIGLGLYIVFGFVKKMGGFVRIESEQKKGTKVIISIPQKITDAKPCVEVEHSEKLNVVSYLKPTKYKSLAIREYYQSILRTTFNNLGIKFSLVTEPEKLKSLVEGGDITNIFSAEEEYLDDKSYYDELSKKMNVAIAVRDDFVVPPGSNLSLIRKPVFSLSIINTINSKMAVWEFDPESSGKKLFFENVKTLVVDDEEMNLIVAKGILSGYGLDVTVVRSGMEAVHECEKNRYDVIFMDHMMPGMDGVEAMKMIKRNYGADDHTAIIAFTANAVSGVREKFMKEGFSEFISKPIEISELERVLKKVLPSSMWTYKAIEPEGYIPLESRTDASVNTVNNSVLNTKEGIRNCRGSEAFYREVLEEFVNEADDILAELQEFFDNRDWKNYRIKLNGLKLAAKLIGAENLSKEAREIERAAAETWEAYIIANHEAIGREMEIVTADIQKNYGGTAS